PRGDRQRRLPPQLDEALQVIRRQRLLEPDDAVVRQHFGRFQGPLVAVRPELFAAAGVHHQFDVRADRVAGRADQFLVGAAVAAAERAPAELERLEAAGHGLLQLLAQARRLVEEERAVGLDAVAVT